MGTELISTISAQRPLIASPTVLRRRRFRHSWHKNNKDGRETENRMLTTSTMEMEMEMEMDLGMETKMEMEIERGQDNHDLALSLPVECMAVIFSFVGGNCNTHAEDSSHSSHYYSCTQAGRFYQSLALVCRSWKQSIETSLPYLVANNLEIVLEGPLLLQHDGGTDSLLRWLERFHLRPSSIRAPNRFVANEKLALSRILHNTNAVKDVTELSIGGRNNNSCDESSLVLAMQQQQREQQKQQHGDDTCLHELIANQCPNLRKLDIALDVSSIISSGNTHRHPSEKLFSLKSIRSLSLMPVYYSSCSSSSTSSLPLSSSDGDESNHHHHQLDMTFITRWVENLPALEHLDLRGSGLHSAPPSKLLLVSDSLTTMHGYNWANQVWINIDRCPKIFPYM